MLGRQESMLKWFYLYKKKLKLGLRYLHKLASIPFSLFAQTFEASVDWFKCKKAPEQCGIKVASSLIQPNGIN